MKLGFIIPVYKNPEQLERCKKHIHDMTVNSNDHIEIFEYDNNEYNQGFTYAVNEGLKFFMEYDYCVVLNQDCYIAEDFMVELDKFMDAHPACAIAGVKQISDKDPDFIIHGGCLEAFPEGRHRAGRLSAGDCNKDKQMPWVNGACMVVNMSWLSTIGMMDENYFLLGSDSDWCYTARMKGAEVWYAADITVIHEQGGVSNSKASKELEYKKVLDMVYFRDKWIGDGVFRELSQEVFG